MLIKMNVIVLRRFNGGVSRVERTNFLFQLFAWILQGKRRQKEFQNKITVAFTVIPKSIFVAMMTHSIDNIHTPNHFHMKFEIQIAPFYC